MKIKQIEITNCKSYLDTTRLSLENDFNILVGPNAGGKSNTLDIMKIALRKSLITSYQPQGSGGNKRIREQNVFGGSNRVLEPFSGNKEEDSVVKLTIETKKSDIENIKTIRDNIDVFEHKLDTFRSHPNISSISEWNINEIEAGEEIEYEIVNGSLRTHSSGNSAVFQEYLDKFQLFKLFTRYISDISLTPTFLHFPPHRSVSGDVLNVNLSSNQFESRVIDYWGTTSKDGASILELATMYFARKKRVYESEAESDGYRDRWDDDREVQLVTKYMRRLGYSWSVELVDAMDNEYSIRLEDEDKSFNIGQASSGEKEIISFLLGVFAFRMTGGLILIDEPELHLHPRWQHVLRDLFIELSDVTNNQFVISTHSAVLISPDTLPNIRRISKDPKSSTTIDATSNLEDHSRRDLLHVVKSHNNERMFFCRPCSTGGRVAGQNIVRKCNRTVDDRWSHENNRGTKRRWSR